MAEDLQQRLGVDDLALHYLANGSTVASFTYELDKAGNRTRKTAAEGELFGYDAVYRLLTVASSRPEVFKYDVVGNRQGGPGANDAGYQHDQGNRMLQGRKLGYGYDGNGNQSARVVPGAGDKSWTQGWDYENRLVKVEKVKGTERKTLVFSYDPFGRRVGKTVTVVKGGAQKSASWSYVYDGDNIVLEQYQDESGALTKTYYTHGSGADEHLALERNGQHYYYHPDGLGSIGSITDANRSVVQSYQYDSFGMSRPATGFSNPYTYTGREWDKETGLYYYRARYYDPMEGRFISKDPIRFKGGDVNLYGYVKNNSINKVDPDGKSLKDAFEKVKNIFDKGKCAYFAIKCVQIGTSCNKQNQKK